MNCKKKGGRREGGFQKRRGELHKTGDSQIEEIAREENYTRVGVARDGPKDKTR